MEARVVVVAVAVGDDGLVDMLTLASASLRASLDSILIVVVCNDDPS